MNVLLSIAIILQIYLIYRTPPHQNVTTLDANMRVASFYDFPPRGLRRTVDSTDNVPQNTTNDGSAKTLVYNEKQMEQFQSRVVTVHRDPPGSAENDFNADKMRRNRNMILYGNEDGPVKKQAQEVQPWDDDQFANFRPSKYDYRRPAKTTIFNLPTQPKPSNESNIAVIVFSGRANFERRQVIRETWAMNHTNVYFIIGGPEPDNRADKNLADKNSTSSRLSLEQQEYGDLLDTIHPDTYKGLPYKLHYAIDWVCHHPGMKHVQWIMKVDDDVVARINTLQYYVLRNLNPHTPLVIGRIDPGSTPHHQGKWAEDPKWAGIGGVDEYPPWAYGSSGYVMSRVVADYIASNKSLYYYQGEDASLGIWLYESPLDVSWIDSPDFNIYKQPWHDHQTSVVIGHNLSTEDIRFFFDKWKDPTVLNEPSHTNHKSTKGRIYLTEQRIDRPEYEEFMDQEERDYDWQMPATGEKSQQADGQSIRAELNPGRNS